MNVGNASFITTAVDRAGYPESGLPEVAFIGRSNVGKSSLINAMASRKSLARTSQNPGKTRTINFYNIENKISFVDLPGYGYAKASKSDVKSWGKMIEDYLKNRKELKGTVLLIDLRREPTPDDILMYNWLIHFNQKTIIACTKSDKLNVSETAKNLKLIKQTLQLSEKVPVIAFSSVKKTGRDELWLELEKLL
ncbi:MAG: ribosome biogenesis GTP-binding protein YihA/YsxC [Clostridiales bacterium]|jgi:GTP-binding protein|nr:ribosome biogenesis GTP-binding protein YihA/YsxC [Clostridiales bacterium]